MAHRRVFHFNEKSDENIILSVESGYKFGTLDIVEIPIKTFFSKLGDVSVFINLLLQFTPAIFAETSGPFAVNSAIGILRLFNVLLTRGLAEK